MKTTVQKNYSPGFFLIVDKPKGVSSTFIGNRLKRLFNEYFNDFSDKSINETFNDISNNKVGNNKKTKIGHIGTLDPLATGVLIIAINEATKIIPYREKSTKEYEFTIKFGEQRSTDDEEGEVIKTTNFIPSFEEIKSVLPKFIGKIMQKPPAFSAIKINGERAYKIAREGNVENLEKKIKEREVIIESLDILGFKDNAAHLKVVCGEGTYVRSLARDIALELKSLGFVSYLRRTRDGNFSCDDALKFEKIVELIEKQSIMKYTLCMRRFLKNTLVVEVSRDSSLRLIKGDVCPIVCGGNNRESSLNEGDLVLIYNDLIPICVAIVKGLNLVPKRVFFNKKGEN